MTDQVEGAIKRVFSLIYSGYEIGSVASFFPYGDASEVDLELIPTTPAPEGKRIHSYVARNFVDILFDPRGDSYMTKVYEGDPDNKTVDEKIADYDLLDLSELIIVKGTIKIRKFRDKTNKAIETEEPPFLIGKSPFSKRCIAFLKHDFSDYQSLDKAAEDVKAMWGIDISRAKFYELMKSDIPCEDDEWAYFD